MRRFSCIVIALLVAATIARGEWRVVSSEAVGVPVSGVEHRRVVCEDSENGNRTNIELALFSTASARIRVIDNARGDDTLAEAVAREHCIAGVNGGYFAPDNAPVGLVMIDGKSSSPFRKARLLSGVLVADGKRVHLLRSAEFSTRSKYSAALQCGPFLVDSGQPVAGLETTRSARRTFVATASGDRVAIGFCSDATLAELGQLLSLTAIAPGGKFNRALNLDGGSSSAFSFAGNGAPFSISEQKTVRNFMAIVPR
jgi:exopolysaccharide biosynthesis protein